MLTSNFSHSGLLHLGINMLAFSGFGSAVCQARPRAQPGPNPEGRLSSGVRGFILRTFIMRTCTVHCCSPRPSAAGMLLGWRRAACARSV